MSVPEKTITSLLGKTVDFVIDSSNKANSLGRSFVAISIVTLRSFLVIIIFQFFYTQMHNQPIFTFIYKVLKTDFLIEI